MKKLFALSIVLFSLVGGSVSAFADAQGFSGLPTSADLDQATAARAIVFAAASNTLVKGGIVLATGAAALRREILPGLVLTLATAIGVVFLL